MCSLCTLIDMFNSIWLSDLISPPVLHQLSQKSKIVEYKTFQMFCFINSSSEKNWFEKMRGWKRIDQRGKRETIKFKINVF